MAETVGQQLAEKSAAVAFKASENIQMANLFMALLGKAIVEARQRGKPIEGVTFDRPFMTGKSIQVKVNFSGLQTDLSIPMLDRRYDDVGKFVMANSAGLALAMRRNPQFSKLLAALFDMLELFCKHKGWAYKDLKVDQAFLDKEDFLIIKLSDGRLLS